MSKTCAVCSKTYTLDEFLKLAPPQNGKDTGAGLIWRQCSCANTITVWADETEKLDSGGAPVLDED